MAVMHPRVAHNYLKDGYYPTDDATLIDVAKRLRLKSGTHRLLDPCCGEGKALTLLANAIHKAEHCQLHTYGVELDANRAKLASQTLDNVLRSNTFDTVIGAGSQSVLFLNPPYGDTVTDHIEASSRAMARLEVQFTQRCLPTLKTDGILVLVIPYPSLTSPFSRYLAQRLHHVQVFPASTDRFKQVVIIGKKADRRGPQYQEERDYISQQLVAIGQGQPCPVMTPTQIEISPVQTSAFRFEMVRPDKNQLEQAFGAHQGLWPTLTLQFNPLQRQSVPRPLKRLSPWHLSLSLAAGQIAGKVISNDGRRTLLVKGGTQKVQRTMTSIDEHQTITTKIDQFQPLIRAIELTPGEDFGRIVIIQ